MMHRILTVATVTIASLVAPAAASAAIMIGAESNAEIVNSTVTPAAQTATLLTMRLQGTQVVRANFGWNEIATGACAGQTPALLAVHTNPCYNWTLVDNFATTTKAFGMKSLVSFTRNPSWVLGNADPHYMGTTTAEFHTLTNHYAAFLAAAGDRYKAGSPFGTITYWTIHNESNSPTFWKPKPDATRYGYLFAKAAVALRGTNPGAKIAAGPTNPTGNGPGGIKPAVFVNQATKAMRTYLPGGLANQRTFLNAWAHNPYPGVTAQPSVPAKVAAPTVIGMATIDRLFTALDKDPLTKGIKVWATEFGYNTSGDQAISERQQAQFLAEVFDWLDSKKRVEMGISYGLSDEKDGYWKSGTYRVNGTPKPSHWMMQRLISVPAGGLNGVVKRNATVQIYGRSAIAPKSAQLVYRIVGRQCMKGYTWCPVKRTKTAGGAMRAAMKLPAGSYQFAVWDNGDTTRSIPAGYGPSRSIRSR